MSLNNFVIIFFTYIKISKDSSAKYYQKKAGEICQSLSKEEKEKKATIWSWTIQKITRR